jgi:hypothetical protein
MLRWEMGDERFFKGLKSYLTDSTIAKGFASQENFVKHMETAADTTFTEFFNDWYYGEGYPVYRLTYSPDPINSAKQILRVSQSPSHPSVNFFKMHLPVRVWSGGNYEDLRLYNTKQDEEFVIPGGTIDSIQFDPERWLCAKVDNVLPAHEISKFDYIQIIPEYSSNKIQVILPDFTGSETFRIFDLNGKTFINNILQDKVSWININGLKEGFYLVEVQTKDQKKVEKFVVCK